MRKTGLFVALLCLLLPVLAPISAHAQGVTFPSVAVGNVAAGPTIPAWVYRPAGSGPFPAVIVMHHCGGVDALTEKWSKRLASWGYFVVAPDSLKPRGLSNVCKGGFSPRERVADVAGALDYLASRPDVIKGKVVAIGMSHGGSLAIWTTQGNFNLAARGLRGAVGVYPGCNDNMKNIGLPLLILSGEKDDWTPAAACQALQGAGSPSPEIVVFPGASHGFDNDQVPKATVPCNKGNCHMAYDSRADQETINRTKAFLDRLLH